MSILTSLTLQNFTGHTRPYCVLLYKYFCETCRTIHMSHCRKRFLCNLSNCTKISFNTCPAAQKLLGHVSNCRNVSVAGVHNYTCGTVQTLMLHVPNCTKLPVTRFLFHKFPIDVGQKRHLSYFTIFVITRVQLYTCRTVQHFMLHVSDTRKLLVTRVQTAICHTV